MLLMVFSLTQSSMWAPLDLSRYAREDWGAEDPSFDERFAQKVAARRANRVQAISDWTNLMIGLPPAPHLLQLLGAMSQNPAVADEFTDNFNQPERQWDILATPERTAAFLARHGM